MNFDHIRFDVADGVARLTLNRPDKLNSFTGQMHAEIRSALSLVQDDPSIRVLVLTGAAAMIEMVYHLQLNVVMGDRVPFLGLTLDTTSVDSWFGALFVMLTGLGMFEVARRHFLRQWGEIQEFIEKEMKRRETL
mgnify:CR=1 FL=1